MIDIKQEFLLPLPFRIFGFAVALGGIAGLIILIYQWVAFGSFSGWLITSLLAAFGGLLIATMHYRLRIDPEGKWFMIYVWMLGYKQGKKENLGLITHFYVNRVIESTRMSSFTGHPNEVKQYLFKAFMKLDNGNKVHLDTDKTEHRLVTRLEEYKKNLASVTAAGQDQV